MSFMYYQKDRLHIYLRIFSFFTFLQCQLNVFNIQGKILITLFQRYLPVGLAACSEYFPAKRS